MNKKGIACVAAVAATSIIPAVVVFQVLFGIIGAAAVWHIPAWEQAKKNHTEIQYQAQQMWPQQVFAKLPGGTPHTIEVVSGGNGGNLTGGNSGPQ